MKLINEGCYSEMKNALYGDDAFGNKLEAPVGFILLDKGTRLAEKDIPFDVYGGWFLTCIISLDHCHHAYSEGRWTAYARPITPPSEVK